LVSTSEGGFVKVNTATKNYAVLYYFAASNFWKKNNKNELQQNKIIVHNNYKLKN
jgi:hypothetical protein